MTVANKVVHESYHSSPPVEREAVATIEVRLNHAVRYCINNYYPDLNQQTIQLIKSQDKDYFLATSGVPITGFNIYFTRSLKKLSTKAILGVVCHELAHISVDVRKGTLWALWNSFRMAINKNYRSKMESQADMDVLTRGAGKYLLAFLEYHDSKYKRYTKKDGLTQKQVRKLIDNY